MAAELHLQADPVEKDQSDDAEMGYPAIWAQGHLGADIWAQTFGLSYFWAGVF